MSFPVDDKLEQKPVQFFQNLRVSHESLWQVKFRKNTYVFTTDLGIFRSIV